ncbi:MAG: regulatory protein RecX [Clostridia bacterium]|nr:regulatory protein RecX [Clostridia bacterium]
MSSNPYSAFDYGAYILGLHDRSEKELYEKLLKKGYSPEESASAMAKLANYGYIDDTRYARHYAEQKLHSYGKRKVEYDLLHKGVSAEVVSEVLEELVDEDIMIDEIKAVMKKKLKGTVPEDRAQLKKLFDSFARKSYEYELVKKAYNLYTEEIENFESE